MVRDPADEIPLMKQDLQSHAKTISALTDELHLVRTDREVRKERDKQVHERFDRIETSLREMKVDYANDLEALRKEFTTALGKITRLGNFVAMGMGGVLLAAIGKWIISGALNGH